MSHPRIGINLASEPFRRDRPIFAASVAVSVVLGLLLIVLTWMAILQRSQAAAARDAIAALEKQIQTLDREQAKINGVLRKPENAQVLDQSVFLNILLQRKGISWTKIFGDLETVIPYNVRIISVRPQVDPSNNHVQLDLFVGAQTTEPIIEMMMKLEQSSLFGKVSIANWLPPTQTEPYYRNRLTVNYAQKL